MPKRLRPWLVPIYALLPEDPAGPDATSGTVGAPAQPAPAELGEKGEAALRARTEEKKAAEAARRTAEKERDEALARLKKLDEEKLSDQEKATRRAEEAEDRAVKAESRVLRLEVVTEAGLPAAMAGRLQGGTKDELLADAESLKALLAPANGTNGDGQGGEGSPPQGTSPRVPKPDMSQGGGKPTDGKSITAGVSLYEDRKKQQSTPFIT